MMLAYYIMYLVVIIGVINHKNHKIGYFVWAVLLFFSIFRGDMVGTDTQNYISNDYLSFRTATSFNISSSISLEFLTNFVFRIIEWGANPRLIITFYSVVTFVFLLLLAKRANINLAFLMMVFLLGGGYIYSFNISRQWAAIAIAAYAVTYIYDQNYKKALLFFPLIILAGSIHSISYSYLLVFFFRFIKLNIPLAVSMLIVCLIISMVSNFNIDSSRLVFWGNYLDTYGDALDVRTERSFLGRIATLYFVMIYVAIILKMEKCKIQYLLPLFVFCVAIDFLTERLDSVIHRFFMFYSFMGSAIVAKYFTSDKSNQILLIAYLLITTYLFFSSGFKDLYTLTFNIF